MFCTSALRLPGALSLEGPANIQKYDYKTAKEQDKSPKSHIYPFLPFPGALLPMFQAPVLNMVQLHRLNLCLTFHTCHFCNYVVLPYFFSVKYKIF